MSQVYSREPQHNPDSLIAKRLVRLKQSRLGVKRLQSMMQEKRPRGMRLRYGELKPGFIIMEARDFEAIRVANQALRGLV